MKTLLLTLLLVTTAHAQQHSRYLTTSPLDYSAILPPPPAPGTPAAQADLAAVHAAEAARTPAQVADAQRDDREESIFAFTSVLAPGLRPQDLPRTAALSTYLRQESAAVNPQLKIAFARPRPFLADPTLHPVCERTASNSYPSGHSMVGWLEALALAQIFPAQHDAILARAAEYAHNRVICGVHYPSDIEASHTVALLLFGQLITTPGFQRDLAEARTELRHRLQLP